MLVVVLGSAWAQAQSLKLSVGLGEVARTETSFRASREPIPAFWEERSITLSELGLTRPLVLNRLRPNHTLYFPMPTRLPVAGVHWELSYRYLGAGSTPSWLSVVVNERPMAHHPLASSPDLQMLTGVFDGRQDTTGFLRLELRLASTASATEDCASGQGPVSLVLEPSTRIVFRFATVPTITVGDAWALMPSVAPVLIPYGELSPQTYETAWRVGAALSAANRRVLFQPLVGPGRRVDTRQVDVPKLLSGMPAFRALSTRQEVVLADDAQLAAWVLLRLQGRPRPAVLVVDQPLARAITRGVVALQSQFEDRRVVQAHAFATWLHERLGVVVDGALASNVLIQPTVGGAVLVVGGDSSAAFSQLADPVWASLVRTSGASWALQTEPVTPGSELRFQDLGLPVGAVAVAGITESTGFFDLSHVRLGGRLPQELVLEVMSPADTGSAHFAMSVYLNDVLLTAKRGQLDGDTYRLHAKLPASVLRPRNVVRVVYERLLVGSDCAEPASAFVVLPTSHLVLKSDSLGADFTGAGFALSSSGHVYVPPHFLRAPEQTLPDLIWVGQALGVPPGKINLNVMPAGRADAWPAPFLAWDVPVQQDVGNSRSNGWAGDLAGDGVALKVRLLNQSPAVFIHTVGQGLSAATPRLTLSHGSSVWVPRDGSVVELNADGEVLAPYSEELREPWFKRNLAWWLPSLLVLSFVGLLVAASYQRRVRR